MIGLLSINHSGKKTKKQQGGEGNGLNPAAIFTGGSGNSRVVVHGRFRGEWVDTFQNNTDCPILWRGEDTEEDSHPVS